nr:retrovirus-related Pol polyprotein from transposon TNT 1-94 [Tanacetum cinerariifolium]
MKGHFTRECRSPMDSRRNGVAEPQRRKVEPANYALMPFSSSSSSSDNEHAETSIPAATPKLTSPKPTSNGKRRNRKACFMCKSLDHLIKDCNYHEKQMVQPTTRNHAHKDSLGKFDGKVDKGFLVGYSVSSKAFRVSNSRTRIFQETLHVNLLENKPNVAGFQDKFDAEKAEEEIDQQYVLFPVWSSGSTNPQNSNRDAAFDGKEPDFEVKKPEPNLNFYPRSSAQSRKQDDKTKKEAKGKKLEDIITYSDDENDVGTEADFNNLE